MLVAPRGLRPLAALLGTGLAIGVSFSILVLGWHFPSDVLGGFFIAGADDLAHAGGALVGRGSLARADRPARRRARRRGRRRSTGPRGDPRPQRRRGDRAVAIRGHVLAAYSASHLSFVAGAATIAGLAGVLATATAFALRR